jgi:hypothetical protein
MANERRPQRGKGGNEPRQENMSGNSGNTNPQNQNKNPNEKVPTSIEEKRATWETD